MNWYEFYLLIEEFIFLMKMPGSIEVLFLKSELKIIKILTFLKILKIIHIIY